MYNTESEYWSLVPSGMSQFGVTKTKYDVLVLWFCGKVDGSEGKHLY